VMDPAMIERLESLSTSEFGDAPWSDEELLAVVSDTSRIKARLHACEVLFRRDLQKFLGTIGAPTVAAIYAVALKQRAATDLNPWGFLGQGDLGPMGQHLVACGDSAVTELSPLLGARQPAGLYSGSKESKLGDSDNARICDFAAFFISLVKGLPYSFHRESIARRDAEIELLKKKLQDCL